jgi:hypothetical protein
MDLRPRTWLLPIALMVAALTPALAQESPQLPASIKALKCAKASGEVRVSYRIDGAIGPELLDSLEGGIPVTFVNKLTIVRRRALFFDKTLARMTVEVTVSMDTLTRQYTLSRRIGEGPPERTTTESRDAMEAWLTELHDVPISLPGDSDKGVLELRVKAEYERNYYVLWVLPWSLSAIDSKECR